MKEFNEYMEEFKKYDLNEKKEISLEQLKAIASLTNTMCTELGKENDFIITKDILEGQAQNSSEEDYVEAVVVYSSSIQESLCALAERITEILKENSGN